MNELTLEYFAVLGVTTLGTFCGGVASEFAIQNSRYARNSIELRSKINRDIIPGIITVPHHIWGYN
jgi:hypothetical protein